MRTPHLPESLKAFADAFADGGVIHDVRRDRGAQISNLGKQSPQPLHIAGVADVHRGSQRSNTRPGTPVAGVQVVRHRTIDVMGQHDVPDRQSHLAGPDAGDRVAQVATGYDE